MAAGLTPTSVLLGQTPPSIDIDAVVDSGAQSDLLPLSAFLSAGYQQADLRPVTLNVSAANLSLIQIEGAFLARISGQSSCGESHATRWCMSAALYETCSSRTPRC